MQQGGHLSAALFILILLIVYFKPLIKGIRQRRTTIPIRPIAIPITMWLHTIVRHIPTPRSKAPIIPISVAPMVFPDSFTGALFSIFLQMITIISSTMIPIQPITIPGLNAFHSGINAMHMPSANKMPPIVPKIIAINVLFFIIPDLPFFLPLPQRSVPSAYFPLQSHSDVPNVLPALLCLLPLLPSALRLVFPLPLPQSRPP